ncbi:MAG: hypothetical protein ABSA53_13555 [Streptosporangiaceae bacterium]
MSDMEETEGSEGQVPPRRRVIGTPPPTPRLLGSTAVAEAGDSEAGRISDEKGTGEHFHGRLPADPASEQHAKRAEKVVAACFVFAFIAGCGFIAAYVGLGVHSVDNRWPSRSSPSASACCCGCGT